MVAVIMIGPRITACRGDVSPRGSLWCRKRYGTYALGSLFLELEKRKKKKNMKKMAVYDTFFIDTFIQLSVYYQSVLPHAHKRRKAPRNYCKQLLSAQDYGYTVPDSRF